ncbi:hypothetical protein [Actinoplanes palleronii]|uniref:Flavodoxin-like domain-containing protein n=1 Tax=Actinoplanes palleronii TaxID=113570 RepID=A0ABQ4BMI1_9ACTN|nr:hypothetical protein [Actinoplanes palleronii]GIE71868.1 hypothetical protein Apa02nite_079760 [Actinoplanes palleronii]
MNRSEQGEPSKNRRAIKLSNVQRSLIGLVGATVISAGIVAIFVREGQTGAATLTIIGGLILLVGIGGYLPQRVGVSGVEFVEEVLETLEGEGVPRPTIDAVEVDLREKRAARSEAEAEAAPSPDTFEATFEDLIQGALPSYLRFEARKESTAESPCGAIEMRSTRNSSMSQKVIIGSAAFDLRTKVEESVARLAGMELGGLIFIASGRRGSEYEAVLKRWFTRRARNAGLHNAHLIFVTGVDEFSRREVASAIKRAWASLTNPPSQQSAQGVTGRESDSSGEA